MYHKVLTNEFEIREMSTDDFWPLWQANSKSVFGENSQFFTIRDTYTNEDSEKSQALKLRMGDLLRINLGVFHNGNFVGWSWGIQESAESFYMCNSGILPDYRKRGLYTQLMNAIVDIAVEQGFQRIYSRHTTTNNPIIIPKLKRGFVITNLELNIAFGSLVYLSYFPKEIARKIMNYRAGQIRADEEIKKYLKL